MKRLYYFTTIALILIIISTVAAQQKPGPILAGKDIAVVSTKYGKVRGYIDDGIYTFKGIPYAKAERFMPPQAPDQWQDVRQCTLFGPAAMQPTRQTWKGQSDNNFG